ncbi:DUF2076 domain-containing protein [Pseudoxanthobacter sp. M-2]|uniref:DUF2076 domain-containing protein n=1 Tax=Pseudoxanthobacter sp. M-2 TaxID=3078754 RepID=UPI0038FCD343
MDNSDRQAIEGLFQRLNQVESQSPPRDGEAEAFIRAEIARQPGAPYYMAQTIVMQDYALQSAQARIEELEQELSARPAGGGGLLGGLFGGGSREPARPRTVPRVGMGAQPMAAQPMGAPGMGAPGAGAAGMGAAGMGAAGMAQRPGGGFLAGAAQTAMGVAGGMLLGSAIAGMFQGDQAQAAEPAAPPADEPPADDVGAADMGGGDEGGGGFFDSFFGGDEL